MADGFKLHSPGVLQISFFTTHKGVRKTPVAVPKCPINILILCQNLSKQYRTRLSSVCRDVFMEVQCTLRIEQLGRPFRTIQEASVSTIFLFLDVQKRVTSVDLVSAELERALAPF